MTKLPGAGRAVVEVRKLRDYVLCAEHPRGKHKAKIFAATLELTADGADDLRRALLSAARPKTLSQGTGMSMASGTY